MQGPPAGPEQQRIETAGPRRSRKQLMQHRQEGIARAQSAAEFGNGFSPMPGLWALQQHRPAGQIQSPLLELAAQGVVSPAVADVQIRQATLQLAAQGEVAAERAATVVHKRQGQCAILAMAAPLP